jgi:6-phosphogluconolactonase
MYFTNRFLFGLKSQSRDLADKPSGNHFDSLNKTAPLRRLLEMFYKSILVGALLASQVHAGPVFIGTSSGKDSGSKGIYFADFDADTGKLAVPVLAAEYQNPGFLALHPTLPILYACGQPTRPFPDNSHSVAAFGIGTDQSLTFIGEASSGGKGACHVAVDGTGRTLAVANYGDGSFSTVRLDEKGGLQERVSLISNRGSGPNLPRQDGPHAHGVYFDRANKRFFMPDLGLDRVFVHSFDAATSRLGEPMAPITAAVGSGPRHIAFSPDEKHCYVLNELSNTILITSYAGGEFKSLGTVPTLPADVTGKNTSSEIEVHPNGRFVYSSNRGHDSIAVFKRDVATGLLTFVQHAPCGGKTPRHFKIDPTGKWLLCGHQASNTIRVLPLDPETGLLGEPGEAVACPAPICLLFGR